MPNLHAEIAFRDRPRASREWEAFRDLLPRGVLDHLQRALATCADPDGALRALSQLRHSQPPAFHHLCRTPPRLKAAVSVFSHSAFLTGDLLADLRPLDALFSSGHLYRPFTTLDYLEQMQRSGGDASTVPSFRRQALLRILLRDVLGIATLAETTSELSHLADAALEFVYQQVMAEMSAQWGAPEGGGFSVIAMGKLGGEELNYSSDIDLMYIYGRNGQTAAADGRGLSNKEFFHKAAVRYTALLGASSAGGQGYRVDLRLRPEGRLGEAALSLEAAQTYYRKRARDWELQMLIKARVAAGDAAAGRQLIAMVEPLTYSTSLDFSAIEAVSESRLRISEKMHARKKAATAPDVKLMRGGIRDIEFLVQCLQRLHGGREPWVRHGGTLLALTRLHDKSLLSDIEYSDLASAYTFFRQVEHRLQVVDDRQTHSLPTDPADLELLARRVTARTLGIAVEGDGLMRQLDQHRRRVEHLYERVIHAQSPADDSSNKTASSGEAPPLWPPPGGEETQLIAPNLRRLLDWAAPQLASALARRPLARNRTSFERFLDGLHQEPQRLVALDESPMLCAHLIEAFNYSPWLAEQLNRSAEYLDCLRNLRQPPLIPDRTAEAGMRAVRQKFSQEMFRLLAASLCLHAPIFESLQSASLLADGVIDAAYQMAIAEVLPGHSGMMVIALGRLGMLEFDLASDADLIFVVPDAEAPRLEQWTKAAEKIIDLLTAYTGDGSMFAVDTRLRPGGRDGALVQTEQTVKQYFEERAEAWEGIAYMKARAAGGDRLQATRFLHDLQQIDWRRYGQSGRSQEELGEMRRRIEREQGANNALKAGAGGYYDIDFALMFLRLKGAVHFYPALNTPARIRVVQQMGLMSAADAAFLHRAATFYRAVDHGLRLLTGHSGGSLPTAPAHLVPLTEIVRRWAPAPRPNLSLALELKEIQGQTREYFDRVFE
ncbi:MAG: glutamine-synthetase adenylyltransferase [Acidobacteria bacterium]|nr:glutamine-synthetase adenylyltransferase [Acidobacteriota bacterium]